MKSRGVEAIFCNHLDVCAAETQAAVIKSACVCLRVFVRLT